MDSGQRPAEVPSGQCKFKTGIQAHQRPGPDHQQPLRVAPTAASSGS